MKIKQNKLYTTKEEAIKLEKIIKSTFKNRVIVRHLLKDIEIVNLKENPEMKIYIETIKDNKN